VRNVPIEKVKVFERSYAEVLAALKHQDDKLNRTLTALAFLTAAGVAVYVNLEEPDDVVQFSGTGPSVTAVLFVVFLGAVALALLTALAAIGPGRPLAKANTSASKSLLFYPLIAMNGEWDKFLGWSDDELDKELTRHYHAEAFDIAKRVRYKVGRARESGAFVQLAIVSLTLLGIFETRPLGLAACWWIATGLITIVLLGQLWELLQMKHYGYENADWGGIATWMLVAVSLVVAGLVLAQVLGRDHWTALSYALVVLVLSRFALVRSRAAPWLIRGATLGAVAAVIIAISA
jgi:hypothetical protein